MYVSVCMWMFYIFIWEGISICKQSEIMWCVKRKKNDPFKSIHLNYSELKLTFWEKKGQHSGLKESAILSASETEEVSSRNLIQVQVASCNISICLCIHLPLVQSERSFLFPHFILILLNVSYINCLHSSLPCLFFFFFAVVYFIICRVFWLVLYWRYPWIHLHCSYRCWVVWK